MEEIASKHSSVEFQSTVILGKNTPLQEDTNTELNLISNIFSRKMLHDEP
jgi:hypothetical protein